MDSRRLHLEEYFEILEAMPSAEKSAMGKSMDVYQGRHPELGEITLVCSLGEDAVLITP
jgi:hypothetical protein